MASCPRGDIVDPSTVGVYHCWSRCVQRAFLCGKDPVSGKDFGHRRLWIYKMQRILAGLFGIEVAFHAELTNHFHAVLRNRPDVVKNWSDHDVVKRWLTITKLAKSKDGRASEPLEARIAVERLIPGRVKVLRTRLSDPSWFMAILCENIGRRSNREVGATGHFWDGRFGCKSLADEAAVLVCGVYIDLNQIRAGEALTPETSRHTSAYDRIRARTRKLRQAADGSTSVSVGLLPDAWLCELTLDERAPVDDPRWLNSASALRASDMGLLPITLESYLEILDSTGRIMREGKSGSIPSHLEPILDRLGIRSEMWSAVITGYDQMFGLVVGAPAKLAERAKAAGKKWYRGKSCCHAAFT